MTTSGALFYKLDGATHLSEEMDADGTYLIGYAAQAVAAYDDEALLNQLAKNDRHDVAVIVDFDARVIRLGNQMVSFDDVRTSRNADPTSPNWVPPVLGCNRHGFDWNIAEAHLQGDPEDD